MLIKSMSKFIGVKMIEAVPMTAREANDKGHKIGNLGRSWICSSMG